MNLEQKSIQDKFNKTLQLTTNNRNEFHGYWLSLTLDELASYIELKLHMNAIELNQKHFILNLLDCIAEKINSSDFGSITHYELYEQRRQAEIELFLSALMISEEDKRYFKDKVEYIEEFSSFVAQCADCSKEVLPHAAALSEQMEGVELCTSCLNSRYC